MWTGLVRLDRECPQPRSAGPYRAASRGSSLHSYELRAGEGPSAPGGGAENLEAEGRSNSAIEEIRHALTASSGANLEQSTASGCAEVR